MFGEHLKFILTINIYIALYTSLLVIAIILTMFNDLRKIYNK